MEKTTVVSKGRSLTTEETKYAERKLLTGNEQLNVLCVDGFITLSDLELFCSIDSPHPNLMSPEQQDATVKLLSYHRGTDVEIDKVPDLTDIFWGIRKHCREKLLKVVAVN